ncbi:MAG TPA: aminotransferase class V-fold PLP-dependent enzyme, partial [Candidatus Angelobacter sp.]|nr:aminotransferase class V-fold PLP-dependent enzyme [Candidatus Angelobacter sp.]
LTIETARLLGEIPGIKIYGPPPEERGGIVAFTLEDVHAHDVATVLDHEGVAVRAGHHCAMPLHTKLGVAATTRASFYVYNLPSDVATMAEGVRKAKKLFSR